MEFWKLGIWFLGYFYYLLLGDNERVQVLKIEWNLIISYSLLFFESLVLALYKSFRMCVCSLINVELAISYWEISLKFRAILREYIFLSLELIWFIYINFTVHFATIFQMFSLSSFITNLGLIFFCVAPKFLRMIERRNVTNSKFLYFLFAF